MGCFDELFLEYHYQFSNTVKFYVAEWSNFNFRRENVCITGADRVHNLKNKSVGGSF